MIREENGIKLFGLFKGLPYGEMCTEDYTDYLAYKNVLSRDTIEAHILSLEAAYCPMAAPKDTYMDINLKCTGVYDDGPFSFPIDFLRYYRTFGIGIPPEYEQYLIETIGLK